jgi:hypothetical protein
MDWPLSRGWAHHDIAVLDDGRFITSHPDGKMLLQFDQDGSLIRTVSVDLTETHGIHVAKSSAQDPMLWIADNGRKTLAWGRRETELQTEGRVVLMDLAGALHLEIGCPPHDAYVSSGWQPCAVVADVPSTTGTPSTIWVADGYGQNLIHCFSGDGTYRFSLDGSGTGTPLDTPHAMLIDTRTEPHELYVADRGNSRIVVYGLDGRFKRIVAHPEILQPSGLALNGDQIAVTDLASGLAVLGPSDELLGRMGSRVQRIGAWPNDRDHEGRLIPPAAADEAQLNSPHGVAVDGNGRILVSEWLVGGRIVCLTPA